MYLEHFKFKEMPFGLTPNIELFCGLKGHEEALNVLLFSLRSGEGFIKIIGEVGSGKTLLCRKILDTLGNDFVTAYLPNPELNPLELRRALARELGIDLTNLQDQHELLMLINKRLLELHHADKRVVLLLDEAQALPLESLEALRLLTNVETEKTKLLQVVLFGQPELDDHLANRQLRQLEQRITFSYYLPLMSREDLDIYLFHRLAMVGHTASSLFAKRAKDRLYHASKGVPRVVNILCHKALLVAYGRGELKITRKIMRSAISDTKITSRSNKAFIIILIIGLAILLDIGWLFYHYKGII
jgi:MSHA biogenesis protein MshM